MGYLSLPIGLAVEASGSPVGSSYSLGKLGAVLHKCEAVQSPAACHSLAPSTGRAESAYHLRTGRRK